MLASTVVNPLVMCLQIVCSGQECTKVCLVTRIIKHIKKEGYLPTFLSPCRHTPGARYWLWANRYQGDLVVTDLEAPEHPHISVKWEVSMFLQYDARNDAHVVLRKPLSIFQPTLSSRFWDGLTLAETSLIWRSFNVRGAIQRSPSYLERSSWIAPFVPSCLSKPLCRTLGLAILSGAQELIDCAWKPSFVTSMWTSQRTTHKYNFTATLQPFYLFWATFVRCTLLLGAGIIIFGR